MHINPDQTITRYDGDPMTQDGEPITLRAVLLLALDMPRKDATAEEKARRYSLLVRLHEADGSLAVTAEEVAALKSDVAETFLAPSAVGAILAALEAPSAVGAILVALDPEEED